MGKNKTELFGIDEFEKTNLGSEWISHFCEILKSHNNKQKLYIPISDVEMKLGRPEYVGKLHDGLYFDKSSNSISSKLEFKSKMNTYFGEIKLLNLNNSYSELGVTRIDCCNIDSLHFEQTEKIINSSSNLPLCNPVDFSGIFNDALTQEFKDSVDMNIYNHILSTPDLLNV